MSDTIEKVIKDIYIIHEDEDILVIDKPAGMTVNKAETTKGEITVQDWMEKRSKIKEQNSKIKEFLNNESEWNKEEEFYNRGGIVHRLDKETSGILVIAKNPKAFAELQRQFKERLIKKEYIALAHGKVAPETGEINIPVGRLPWNRKQFGVIAGGRESVTHYKVLNYYQDKDGENYSLLELYPKTGRTHQIRVHLKYIGHPIFSDFLYAGRKTARKDRNILPRVFLHAANLTLFHPATGKEMTFESKLPEELRELVEEKLKNMYNSRV